jgi:hypothetical protein
VNEFLIVLPSLVIISILIGLHYGYKIVISTQPIETDIQIPESATRKLVDQHAHEHHRVGNISYLTTGTTLSYFEYGCEPYIGSPAPGGPDCLHFGFDEPGKVELEIPKYLVDEFPIIDQVYHGDNSIFGKQIPFQVINEEDNPYVTVRIDVPFNHTIFTVHGRSGGLLSIPASGGNYGMILVYSFLFFWLFFILYVVSKQLVVIIMKKLRN